jgi:hypothetical protein
MITKKSWRDILTNNLELIANSAKVNINFPRQKGEPI